MVITNRFLITTSLWVFASAAHAQAAGCEALMAQIDAKIRAGGVTQFILTTVDASAEAGGRVVGTCDLGTKKIVYEPGPTHGAVSAGRPAQQPASRATTPSASSPASISVRAASTRRFSTACAGDCPVSALKARLNCRGLRCATSARSSTDSGSRRWARAWARVFWMRSDCGSSSSMAENCDWPPGRR